VKKLLKLKIVSLNRTFEICLRYWITFYGVLIQEIQLKIIHELIEFSWKLANLPVSSSHFFAGKSCRFLFFCENKIKYNFQIV